MGKEFTKLNLAWYTRVNGSMTKETDKAIKGTKMEIFIEVNFTTINHTEKVNIPGKTEKFTMVSGFKAAKMVLESGKVC
jgi:hypothetical protein